MFFLGVSAHVLIYFLVPAFLIACGYFGNWTEITGDQPEMTVVPLSYQPTFHSETACFFVYAKEQAAIPELSQTRKPSFSILTIFAFPPASAEILPFYFRSNRILRAPPIAFFS